MGCLQNDTKDELPTPTKQENALHCGAALEILSKLDDSHFSLF